jgi:hypothetical protein
MESIMRALFSMTLLTSALLGHVFSADAKCTAPLLLSDERYQIVSATNDNEVLDKTTNLVWQRCMLGKKWEKSSNTCQGKAESVRWLVAVEKAEKLSTPGAPSWRVPTSFELLTLADFSCNSPAVNSKWFGDTPSEFSWSSSSYQQLPDYAWGVNFKAGNLGYESKIDSYQVRLVRSAR